MIQTTRILSLLLLLFTIHLSAVDVGLDLVFQTPYAEILKGKKVGLVTNQTATNASFESAVDLFARHQEKLQYELKALFAPEHGLYGDIFAEKDVATSKTEAGIPIYSLYGQTRRPTEQMLKGLSLLVFDMQDIGSRSYTYASTLFYVMEEAAKRNISVLVLDRPNPINGLVVDGPMLDEKLRSFIGYVNVPYCHGFTLGELARFFNEEYKVRADLRVVPMKGWKRWMNFKETGRSWTPTSPYIPEASTCLSYPVCGLFGEMRFFVSIGIGYTLPFKVVGAPWIDPELFARTLNRYKLPGVYFSPFRFRPLAGSFTAKACKGVLIHVTNHRQYLPVTTQYLLMSVLKELYPNETKKAIRDVIAEPQSFFKACGTHEIVKILEKEKSPFYQLRRLHAEERKKFLEKRKRYLHPDYGY